LNHKENVFYLFSKLWKKIKRNENHFVCIFKILIMFALSTENANFSFFFSSRCFTGCLFADIDYGFDNA